MSESDRDSDNGGPGPIRPRGPGQPPRRGLPGRGRGLLGLAATATAGQEWHSACMPVRLIGLGGGHVPQAPGPSRSRSDRRRGRTSLSHGRPGHSAALLRLPGRLRVGLGEQQPGSETLPVTRSRRRAAAAAGPRAVTVRVAQADGQ